MDGFTYSIGSSTTTCSSALHTSLSKLIIQWPFFIIWENLRCRSFTATTSGVRSSSKPKIWLLQSNADCLSRGATLLVAIEHKWKQKSGVKMKRLQWWPMSCHLSNLVSIADLLKLILRSRLLVYIRMILAEATKEHVRAWNLPNEYPNPMITSNQQKRLKSDGNNTSLNSWYQWNSILCPKQKEEFKIKRVTAQKVI